ncbi:hypothetical protein HYH03_015845 [Edaphochlamys debaryana]|uniref:Heterokaryon incompatibility domain-containing protein n=1 Tax=Edaphochlamys debaryana TaxID=47281 RepID=A0A836BS45_9CHLO|nr:hypothetical protein HYH03_015845 [Edaphochlamys debaryana]|eukprot:KAG2485469.1 hypothetical protein HYH03_015845 [Edaphochlamys debaryana]
MPASIAQAPMRLLHIEAVLTWTGLKMYEEVQPDECIELPYKSVTEEQWAQTAVLSWRWGAPKPREQQPGFSPMLAPQLEELRLVLQRLQASDLKHIWVDWSCVPQYSADSMVEVLRSKTFYARARVMIVVPTFYPVPEGAVKALLVRTRRQLAKMDTGPAAQAARVLQSILDKELVAGREYFARVWTLAERMARFGHGEQLNSWLSLEAWLGMLADAMLKSLEDKAASQIYKKILGREATELLEACQQPLVETLQTGSMLASDTAIEAEVARLFELATQIWKSPAKLVEQPSRDWLKEYLEEINAGVYQAWSEADRVWAIYSFFCWKTLDQASEQELAQAVRDLVRIAAGNEKHLGLVAAKLGLRELREGVEQRIGREEQARRDAEEIARRQKEEQATREAEEHERRPNKEQEQRLEAGLELLAAVKNEHWDTAMELLAAAVKPDLEAVDEEGRTALIFASRDGHLEVVKALLAAGARVEAADEDGSTPLMHASRHGHLEVVKALLAAGARVEAASKDGCTPLMYASCDGNLEVVKALLAAGARVEAADEEGRTALMFASSDRTLEVVKALLAAGARVEAADEEGRTALMLASRDRTLEMVKALLAAGARVEAADEDGRTALIHASCDGNLEMVKALLAAGARVEAASKDGRTALIHASCDGHLEVVKALLAAGARVEAADEEGRTALMFASSDRTLAVVKALLAAGARVEAADEDGRTALIHASCDGNLEMVKALLAAGARVEAASKDGCTPLIHASCDGNLEVVKALLAAGARVEAADEDGKTALDWARETRQTEVVQLLER